MKPPKVRGSADQFIAQDKKHKEDGMITINALPEEILVRIVSFLPLKDAAATSILSRLWRYVWTFATNLDFDGDRALQSMIFNEDTYLDILDSERAKYINWVNRVMNLHRGGHIDRFRIHFDLDQSFASSIDTWINFAKKKRVQILELELQLMDNSPFYAILGEHVVGFESLKVLRLVYVELTGEVIQCLLSKCKLLEQLEVQCSFKLDKLRVAGPLLALKHLCLYGCHEVESIEIYDALELVSFYLTCDKWQPLRLITRNVPKLVDIYIRLQGKPVRHVFTMLTSCSYPLSQLQILQLNIALEKYVAKRVYPTLTNLKQLNLLLNRCDKYNLLKLIPFMKAFPYLLKLVLKFLPWVDDDDDDGVKELVKATKCPHHSLKEVEILGYSGRRSDVELIIYLIENAVSLEKIIVNPYRFEEFLWTKPHSPLKSKKEEEMAKHHALQHLKEKIPSTMEFICL